MRPNELPVWPGRNLDEWAEKRLAELTRPRVWGLTQFLIHSRYPADLYVRILPEKRGAVLAWRPTNLLLPTYLVRADRFLLRVHQTVDGIQEEGTSFVFHHRTGARVVIPVHTWEPFGTEDRTPTRTGSYGMMIPAGRVGATRVET